MYLFSKTTWGFYPESDRQAYIDAGTLPDDVIEVEDDVRNEYNGQPPTGKILGVDSSGHPVWIDIPPLPTDVLYEQELNEINENYDKDVSDLVLKYSRAGLFDGSAEASKKTELYAALQTLKEKYATDLNDLDNKYGA